MLKMNKYMIFTSQKNFLVRVNRYPASPVAARLSTSFSPSFLSLVRPVCNCDPLRHGFDLHSPIEGPIERSSNRRVEHV